MSRIPPWAKRHMSKDPRPDPAAQLADFAITLIDKVITSSRGDEVGISASWLREQLTSFDDPDPYLERIYELITRHYGEDAVTLVHRDDVVTLIRIRR